MKKLLSIVVCLVFALGILAACAAPAPTPTPTPAPPPIPKDPYIIGDSSDLTGALQPSHGRPPLGFRLYFDELNKRGGIDGHPVKLMLDDNRSDPTKGGTQVAGYVDAKANLIMIYASSAVHAAALPKIKEAKIPLITMVGMAEAQPPTPDPLVFATMWGSTNSNGGRISYGVQVAAKEAFKGISRPLKVFGMSADIPSSRRDTAFALELLKKAGFETNLEILPLTLSDYRPLATKVVEGGWDVVTGSLPGPATSAMSAALNPLGFKGIMLGNTAGDVPATLRTIKANNVYFTADSTLTFDLAPDFQQAAKASGVEAMELVQMGWIDGKVVEQIFKKVGWPCTTDKMLSVMNNLTFDRRPYNGPLIWTANDHIGPSYYRVVRWDTTKGDIVQIGSAYKIDAGTGAGTEYQP